MQVESSDSSVFEKIEDDFSLKLDLKEAGVDEKQPEMEDDGEEEDFSFVCLNPDGSPISADDIFQDGQIRPYYPLFDGYLRRRLEKELAEDCASSVSSSEAEDPEGAYCPWTKKAAEDSGKASPSCRKSNSTGFSRLRRFREMILRSTSDGKDAFVFLHRDHHSHEKPEGPVMAVKKPAAASTAAEKNGKLPRKSAHERLYVQNRATMEGQKRKSYLPYRVGFFTRNVHPY